MCTICGGSRLGSKELRVFHNSRDRGRDYSNMFFRNGSWLCNHRAVPTTEKKNPAYNQPFGTDYKIVHNGTISNDKELGNTTGEIDSSVLATCLDFTTSFTLRDSLKKVKGSYAIGVLKPNGTFYLACNYKPIFYSKLDDGGVVFSSYANHLEEYDNVKRVPPYSILDTENWSNILIERHQSNKALVICSGGLDSTAVAAYAMNQHDEVTLIHYCYGCIAESKETECVKKISEYFNNLYPEKKCNLAYIPIDMSFMNKNSALFKTEEDIHKGIEGSEYAYEWVPARNLIMLSLAVGYAEANDIGHIYLGTNLEESGCLSGDTLIKISENKSVPISELVGKTFNVYGYDLNGNIKYIKAKKCWKTKVVNELYEIFIEKNLHTEIIKCTGNHPIMLNDGTYIEAQDLLTGQKLINSWMVKDVLKIRVDNYPVYDISVPETHNFMLDNGVFVHNSYPDNENQFIKDFDNCLWGAVQNGIKVQVHTPVGNLMKHEIVAFGNKYKAPFELTWSCYKKGEIPCGECGPCFMRRTAFRRNGLEDPLPYPKTMKFDEVEKDVGNIVQDISNSYEHTVLTN